MRHFISILAVYSLFCINAAEASDGQIVVGVAASEMEQYAALELQRYLYQLSGSQLAIVDDNASIDGPAFVVGTKQTNAVVRQLAADGQLEVDSEALGPQGFLLRKLHQNGHPVLAIVGHDAEGTLYGVYGLLDDHYGVGFYFSGDVLPEKKDRLTIPDIDECKTPEMRIRGVLPWTNFHQSATVFSWNDWKFVLDQAAKMRMNFIHIHNYNKSHSWDGRGHTEMFHTFQYQGFLKRSWMASASTGHHWCCPAWDVNEYRFGASDLYGDYDFGADCTLHNESLTNLQVANKGISEFERVISYAHSRGIKIGIGLDIDVVPSEYGVAATNAELVQSRIDQITSHYPELDYLLCFQSEKHSAWSSDEYKQWREIFDQIYDGVKAKSPKTRLAVSGWGLQPEPVASLPEDVICAPIARYGASFENGEIYGDREYWGCPWLEVDGGCSQHYYPYGTHLSTTIASYKKRVPNMTGLYCLTWRLSDAIEPKLSYIAKAPWDLENKYDSSYDVYHEYAQKNYGSENAAAVTEIINENEPFAEDHGECRQTPHFTGSNRRAEQGHVLDLAKITLLNRHSNDQPASTVTKIAAVSYSLRRGPTLQKFKSDDHGEDDHGEYVRKIVCGDWLHFDDVDFGTGANAIALESRVRKDLDVEVRIDGPNGPLVGVCDLAHSAQWQTTQTDTEIVTGKHTLCLRFLLKAKNEYDKATSQLEVVQGLVDKSKDIGQKERLERLENRLASVRNYLKMDEHFPYITWNELPGAFDDWVGNFVARVHDISSLGNIISIQNRFVKLRYVSKVDELRREQQIQSPSDVSARGTTDGTCISWQNEQPSVHGFNVYRDGQQINETLLPPDANTYADQVNGRFAYQVAAVDAAGNESLRSIRSHCSGGDADVADPRVIVISPPTSQPIGQPVDVVARVLDGRAFEEISAMIFFRKPGEPEWIELPMTRQAKAVFGGRIPGHEVTEAGLEYYVAASDGTNTGHFPKAGVMQPASLVGYSIKDITLPSPPSGLVDSDGILKWRASGDDMYWYQIYRSKSPDFLPGPATLLTYLPSDALVFTDKARDRNGQPLLGNYFYRVVAVDEQGNESVPTPIIKIVHGPVQEAS
ncbi:Carbohydrate binding module (family 6) [Planctomycetes bacterium CA13]|uniref:Carbohydrate binding module (Family 6) n=1 Tax=Novipirellula herctigrandis TaxID=2527986 RepID=A0A5C5Z5K9_9BACT|nr:Carbohydrate binding module (family 6) [Planctomycetes bacterium CA13]